ncbi:MAG TPA: molybdopterin-dependent oxidoreductase [bacterium]|nr:molybdopterin-dependent oxidoreductase [bacterium]
MKPITRRQFLWQSGLVAGGLVAAPLVRIGSAGAAAAPENAAAARLSVAHWGPFTGQVTGGRLVRTLPFAKDPYPNRMVAAMPDVLYAPNRIKAPMIRQGFYRDRSRSDTTLRGAEPFVRVSWDEALDIVAGELRRVKTQYGNRSIYSTQGWQSAGNFHAAGAAVQRLLGMYGGYVYRINSYSAPVLPVITPHVLGDAAPRATTWPVIIKNTTFVLMLGYDPLRNAEVRSGGSAGHFDMEWIARLRDAKIPVVSVNPIEGDTDRYLRCKRIAIRPNTDTALLLALAHVLYTENLYDKAFLDKYTVGFSTFADYLSGKADGQAKSPEWAAPITEVPAATIRELAHRIARSRTMLMGGYSLQRASHGEQPVWMLITLAAMTGQIGLPGGGLQLDFPGALGVPLGSAPGVPGLSTGTNPVKDFVPLNLWIDLLASPGKTVDYDGQRITYPDIKLVYLAGSNHLNQAQYTNRALEAWRRPEVTIVHDYVWTPTAKHADIVLPATTTLERNDLFGMDRFIIAMQQMVPPLFEARSDFDICAGLASRLGFGAQYTEGKDEMAWLQQFYGVAQQQARARNVAMPDFDTFWQQGYAEFPVPDSANEVVAYSAFRADPVANPLGTPSGKIELYSERIASFKYDDTPPHATWIPPTEWLGSQQVAQYPLHLLSAHPKERLHSQLDETRLRRDYEVREREPIWIHPQDAAARGIADGDIVRVYNDRGQTLVGAVVTAQTRRAVVVLNQGAWYDPLTPGRLGTLDRHGNINNLSTDAPSSKLSGGNPTNSVLVQVEKYVGMPPEVTAFTPPSGA